MLIGWWAFGRACCRTLLLQVNHPCMLLMLVIEFTFWLALKMKGVPKLFNNTGPSLRPIEKAGA
jgi:hypothetical protein